MINTIRTVYRFFHPYKIKGINNMLDIRQRGKNIRVSVIGNNNTVKIEKAQTLSNLNIFLSGDNNTLIIKRGARIYGPCNIIVEGGGSVKIGENTGLRGVQILSRGAGITMGAECMTSYGVIIRNHDSHHVIEAESGDITNAPKDIVIGNHVWFAQNAVVLKGTNIGCDSILGFGAVVTKDVPCGCVVAGNPAKIVKQGVTWDK